MHRILSHAVFFCTLLLSSIALAEEPFTSSPHAEALRLVLNSQSEELKRLDADLESDESTTRSWAVFRPANGGELDRAYTFTVTFSINGRLIASWYVNTGEGTVEPNNPADKH